MTSHCGINTTALLYQEFLQSGALCLCLHLLWGGCAVVISLMVFQHQLPQKNDSFLNHFPLYTKLN